MTGELFINGADAFQYGVSMGSGFIDTLKATLTFKDDIENNSAIEHGKRVVLTPYIDSRDISLTFVVTGRNKADFEANENTFLDILYSRKLTIKIKGYPDYYRLIYTGKSTSYAHASTSCKITAKFTEVNPKDRAEKTTNDLFVV